MRARISLLRTEEVPPTVPEVEEINALEMLNGSLQEEFSRLESSPIYKSTTKWVIARTSKRYDRTDINYWYETKAIDLDRVKEYGITHFAFICSNKGVMLIPKGQMLRQINQDNLTR